MSDLTYWIMKCKELERELAEEVERRTHIRNDLVISMKMLNTALELARRRRTMLAKHQRDSHDACPECGAHIHAPDCELAWLIREAK